MSLVLEHWLCQRKGDCHRGLIPQIWAAAEAIEEGTSFLEGGVAKWHWELTLLPSFWVCLSPWTYMVWGALGHRWLFLLFTPYALALRKSLRFLPLITTVDAWNQLCKAEVFLRKSLAVVTANMGADVVRKGHKILTKLSAPHVMNYTEYTKLWLSPECCLSTQMSFPSCSSSRNVQVLFLTDCWWI